jgi:hypothetical protein
MEWRKLAAAATAAGLCLATLIGSPARAEDQPIAAPITAAQPPPATPALLGSMVGGNTVGDQIRERMPRADGYRHVDTPRLIRRLKELNVNFYAFQVWSSPTDWDDLRLEFAPAVQEAGIQVMPYLVPPSECWYFGPDGKPFPRLVDRGKCSAPYYLDYVAWGKAIAELSLQYSAVIGWAIDDFSVGSNAATFTPEYMQQIESAQDAINANIGLWITTYHGAAVNPAYVAKYAPYVDGMVFVYYDWGSRPEDGVPAALDAVLSNIEPLGMRLIMLMYVGRHGAAIESTPEDVTGMIDAARPYVTDRRIDGLLSYGTPSGELPEVNNTYRAATGVGRLSLSLSQGVRTLAGDFAAASQHMAVEPGRDKYSITFSERDQWAAVPGLLTGYHRKQMLVDGHVVWESDVVLDGGLHDFTTRTIDVTQAVQGKSTAEVTFRLFEDRGVGDWAEDVSIDDVSAQGLNVTNGGFEERSGWTLSRRGTELLPLIDLWSAYRPVEVAAAVGRAFREMAGEPGQPVHPNHPAKAPKNPRAMFGAGRLSLSVPAGTSTTNGQCASASQQVKVTPGLRRYELSFWHHDQWWNTPAGQGYHAKQVLIDGESLITSSTGGLSTSDRPAHTYIQGQTLKGPVDVTELVAGKASVTLTLRLCETKDAVNIPVDVGFDHIESLGLLVHNPGFEEPTGWTLTSEGNVRATLDITR